MAAIKALQQWCKIQCDGYRDVSIVNMTTSFRDGLAFCALIHKFRPDLISFDALSKDDVYNNNHLAFRVAEDHLGIPALLDAEDMVALPIPDRLSILTYVSQYYNYFNGRAPIGGVGGLKRPAEGSKEEPSEKKNLPVFAQTYSRKVLPESYPRSSSAASKSAENRPPSLSIQNSRSVSPSFKRQPGVEEHPPFTNLQKQSPSSVSASRVRSSDMDTEKKSVLLESSNKTGTLNSKCAVCKNHVHLVQRHLVDGKLYHRSCFKCGVCSAVLQTGKYKAGQQPGTLLCLSHCPQNALKSSAKTSGLDPIEIGLKPESGSGPLPLHHDSTSINPLNIVLKSVETSLAPQPWTASALRTQVARQRFFLSTCEVPTPQNNVVPKSEEEVEQARSLSPTKLAKSNCNNNNKVYSYGLNADKMWTTTSSDKATSWNPKRRGSAATGEEPRHHSPSPPSTTRTSDVGSPWLSAINKEHTRPPSSPLFITKAKDTGGCEAQVDWKSKLNRVQNGTRLIPFTENKALTPEKNKISHTELVRPCAPSALDLPASKTAECFSHKSTAVDQPWHVSNASGGNGNMSFGNGSPVNKSLTIRSCWIPMEQITEELQEIDNSLINLEKEGIDLERRLRKCEEEGSGDILADPLMVEWFNLIRKKQSYIRRESELMHILKTQDLEEEQPGVEGELRRLLNKPEHLKSSSERKREADLMKRLVEIVNDRNAIVEGLEEDRLREEEEDQQLNEMMQTLGLQKLKSRRKSSFSKLFRRRSKKGRVEQ